MYACVQGDFEPKMYWKLIGKCVFGIDSNLLRPFILVFTCGHIFFDTAGDIYGT